MKTAQIDVEIEMDADEIQIGDRNFARQVMERMRDKADAEARAVGGTLRTDVIPEFNTMRAMRPGTSFEQAREVVLCASRWTVDVPESFDPERAAALSR